MSAMGITQPQGVSLAHVLDLDVLRGLPAGTEVMVTKKNPIHWHENEPASEWYFQTANELAANIRPGNFDKMLVIETPSGKVDFPSRRARIMLDDPRRQVSSGENAYDHADTRLRVAAAVGGIEASVERHMCQSGCICLQEYARWGTQKIDLYFS